MHKPLLTSALMMAALLLVACSSDPEQSRAVPVEVPTTPDGDPVTKLGPTVNFDPSTGVVPTPNNLLFIGSEDGTVNIPVADPTDFGDPQVAINALDGFSTVAPMVTTMSDAVDPDTVVAGETVRIFKVGLCSIGPCPAVAGPPNDFERELAPNEFTAFMHPASPTQLVILPLRPLAPSSHYVVVITDGITDADGGHVQASQIYAILKNTDPLVDGDGRSTTVLPDENAQALEPLRQLTQAAESVVSAGSGLSPDRIVLSWTVSTQSIGDVLEHLADTLEPADHMFANSGQTTTDIGGLGHAAIYFGWIDLPYYLQAPDDDPDGPVDPTRILSGHWQGAGGSNLTRFNPAPVERSVQRVPAVMTIPLTSTMPAEGWPLVVFQHGITGNRTQGLALADAAAQAGRAMISIDQPLHGIVDETSPFYAHNPGGAHATPGFAATERHFNVDLVDNASGAPGPDGAIDGSGTHTINLASLLTARDNLRQASADLMQVVATVEELATVDGNVFDETSIHFVGHSLGSMVGIPMLAAAENVATASHMGSGGGIARLLDGSVNFGPRIRAGLSAAGVEAGTPQYDQFMFAAQTVVDSADPINHAARASANMPQHMMIVVGDGADNLTDQTVPVSVAGAPLSGSEPLAAAMGLETITETTSDPAGVWGVVRFLAGHHGSLLTPNDAAGDPSASAAAAFMEMQQQTGTFMATSGTTIPVNNADVVQQ